jgi:hypothetical protein
MKLMIALGAALAVAACAVAPSQPTAGTDPASVEIMVLGAYHMGNPGADLNNATVDPVTTPRKQKQLDDVADALAKFRPTAIAVERVAADQATMLDQQYKAFTPAELLTNPDERVQIGYRLAAKLKLDRVYGIDEQDRPGELSYFPYDAVAAWAEANGRAADLDAIGADVQVEIARFEADQKTRTVGQLLAGINSPGSAMGEDGHAIYMRMLSFGSGDDQPGAVLNARWYARNAMIFAKLKQVAKPGDRIVILYGSGHAYWLRQLVMTTPGFRLVEVTNYLSR